MDLSPSFWKLILVYMLVFSVPHNIAQKVNYSTLRPRPFYFRWRIPSSPGRRVIALAPLEPQRAAAPPPVPTPPPLPLQHAPLALAPRPSRATQPALAPPPPLPEFHLKKKQRKRLQTTPIEITAILAAGMVIILVIIVALCFTRKMTMQRLAFFMKGPTQDDQNVEAVLRHYGKNAPARYTYADTKKFTNSFKHKLGEGGYGSVYKGQLENGRPVAVKLLKKSEGNGQEFINEVSSIFGTNHINIVTLIGFCFQRSRRALIYEFMPNGSLDKYMHGRENAVEWAALLRIAIGIARGLEYLHRGCKTRILHLDIKPQNILLDENFCPKICDFGLSRPCLQKESIVTISRATGTPGYIAPEVFCRGFGGASHKSDVYSYGMLVLDMVGCRKNNVGGIEQLTTSSEPYFPRWIYKQQFEPGQDSELQGITNEEEKRVQRKMVMVSLWCIQTSPSSRPPMSRVVEMLEGSLESLQVPPVPSLFSPPESPPQNCSSTHSMTS